MSHPLAAAELFEAIEKDARALVFPTAEMNRNDFTRALMPVSAEMSVIAGFAQRYAEYCRAYLESGNIAAGKEFAYVQLKEISNMISNACEKYLEPGVRYLPYDVKQHLTKMYLNYTSSVAP